MEVRRSDDVRLDRQMAELIGRLALAGAYRETIRLVPETEAGFGKLAAKHSARAATLADEICARQMGGAAGPGA